MPEQARRERIARNEAAFREVNETLQRGLSAKPDAEAELAGFVCECGDADCSALVHMPLAKYEEIRAEPMQFVICPGHEQPDAEAVVERGGRYAIVRKHEDVRGIAEETDPRA